ncbi:MAG: patatin-like phospholipase family protein [Candidatus Krumholzibacteria bacterium]|nr:patatin-like phospholipase family protein [Candidatus Krumholzibacteria bacterium]
MKKKIGLALGSGGARGLCEIGVLLWLKEHGIEVHCVAGTSIGSIIGGAYAAGFSPEYMREIALSMGWLEFLKAFRLSFKGRSVLEWDKIEAMLRVDLGGKKIEDLPIPFACVAADLDSGREFVFKEGDLVAAMGASACIPGVFPPVELLGRHLVDGELVNPVPLDLAKELGADRVIGVNASRSVFTDRMSHEAGHIGLVEKLDGWVRDSIEKNPLMSSFNARKWLDSVAGDRERKRRRNLIDAFTDSIAIVTSRVLVQNELNAGPHFMINPEVGGFQTFDFDRAQTIIAMGYEETESISGELLEFIEN